MLPVELCLAFVASAIGLALRVLRGVVFQKTDFWVRGRSVFGNGGPSLQLAAGTLRVTRMFSLGVGLGLVFAGSLTEASSFLKTDGMLVESILDGRTGQEHTYSGAGLQPFANLQLAQLNYAMLKDAALHNADLRFADLAQAYLNAADLRFADLYDSNLNRADLTGANLSGANLSQADLSRADLTGAYLSGAQLSHANFNRADLTDANLSGAILGHADFNRSNLTGADLSLADLGGANLNRAYLVAADLSGANLGEANLHRAYLNDANLRGASLSGVAMLGSVTGAPYYDSSTNFGNSWADQYYTAFDPVVAGWTLVPEPNTALLLTLGLSVLGIRRRHR